MEAGSPGWTDQVSNTVNAALSGKKMPVGSSFGTDGSIQGSISTVSSASVAASQKDSVNLAGLLHLISAYQLNGHLKAHLDPLGIHSHNRVPDLDISTYGFQESDLDKPVNIHGWNTEALEGLMGRADMVGNKDGSTSLRELVDFLDQTYCGTTGYEFHHVSDLEKRNWLIEKIEKPNEVKSKAECYEILDRLAFADRFENFLANKFNTAKRFGLEGLESSIAGLKAMIDEATLHGVEHVVSGMPHRGRLTYLANVVRKPMEMIFKEFMGTNVPEDDDYLGSGDVKYHLGTSYQRNYADGRSVEIQLLPNPSHLEAVDPVVVGKAKAKMHYLGDAKGDKVLPIILHGDAAFAGQGILYETMQMSQLPGYGTGGTIHVITNNQIGFTTDTSDSRSTHYSSDLGKAFSAPVFHVNADDPEAVTNVFILAAQYRQTFHTDVVVDVIGYRRYGHNELDQPLFTQPLMYQAIGKHPSTLDIYKKQLVERGVFTQEEVDIHIKTVEDIIRSRYENMGAYEVPKDFWDSSPWGKQGLEVRKLAQDGHPDTGVPSEVLRDVADAMSNFPPHITLHRQISKIMGERKKNLDNGTGLDWGTAEGLAFGSLLKEGVHVRLSAEDAERGTFSHRHAVLHCQKTGESYTPLKNIKDAKQNFEVFNSLLSEYGVLGFELGYSLENPNQLVVWEAQFGDFANGAQIIIDNFLAAGQAKWHLQTGLVMLLPHGYDGQGPEHSSCRIERFLQNSDEDPDVVPAMSVEDQVKNCNWQVMNVTTPANYFHALRRQLERPFRKPLIIASPKALLRLRACSSTWDELLPGNTFHRVIKESEPDKIKKPEEVRRLVFCSGKIYYELLAARQKKEVDDVALVRLEQICPFPFDQVAAELNRYSNAEVVWVQEEPKNMGCWMYVQDRIITASNVLNKKEIRPAYVGRTTMASPAEGYGSVHTRQQNQIIDYALSDKVNSYGHGISK